MKYYGQRGEYGSGESSKTHIVRQPYRANLFIQGSQTGAKGLRSCRFLSGVNKSSDPLVQLVGVTVRL